MVWARTAFTLWRGKQSGHDRVGNLILDDIGRFIPRRMNDHLHVGDVGQGIERHPAHRPDAGQHQEKRSGEDEEAIAGAQIDPAGDHLHASFRGHGELFLGDGLTSLGCQDGDLPGPAHLHLSRSLIDAAALFAERRYVTHGGHAHRRHGGHEERYGDLSARDCRPVGAGELDAEIVASRARESTGLKNIRVLPPAGHSSLPPLPRREAEAQTTPARPASWLSESIRKLAEVTMRSPALRPFNTMKSSPARAPTSISRGSK